MVGTATSVMALSGLGSFLLVDDLMYRFGVLRNPLVPILAIYHRPHNHGHHPDGLSDEGFHMETHEADCPRSAGMPEGPPGGIGATKKIRPTTYRPSVGLRP